MDTIKIKLFANIREIVGEKVIEINIDPDTSVLQLKQKIGELYPDVEPLMNHMIFAINKKFAFDDNIIPLDAEVAIFPPVSGGTDVMRYAELSSVPLRIDEIVNKIVDDTTGGVCSFTGYVRQDIASDGSSSISALQYDVYETMAIEKMHDVITEIAKSWSDIKGIAIVQRIGIVEVGQLSTVVACSSVHRDSGIFFGAKYGIDRMKEIVTIWKKEIYNNKSNWVVGKYVPKLGD